MNALYWMWDAFDRCMINFFLIYKTAEDVLAKRLLDGDGVYIGVRDVDWISGSKPIFTDFVGQPVEKTDKYELYMFGNVPVYLYIFPDDICIRNPQTVLYERENFNLPNPYCQFIELYGNRNS